MGALLLKCPTTGKELSIGVDADRESLADLSAIVSTSICPHCAAEHAWRLEEARYIDAISSDDSPESKGTIFAGKEAR